MNKSAYNGPVVLFFFLTVNDFKRTNLYCVQSCSRDAQQHISYSKTRRKRRKTKHKTNTVSHSVQSAKQHSFQIISQTYAILVSPHESVRMSQSACVSLYV